MEVKLQDSEKESRTMLDDCNRTPIADLEMAYFVREVLTKKSIDSLLELCQEIDNYFFDWNFIKRRSLAARIHALHLMAVRNMLPGWAELKPNGNLSVSSFAYLAACSCKLISRNQQVFFDTNEILREAIKICSDYRKEKRESKTNI